MKQLLFFLPSLRLCNAQNPVNQLIVTVQVHAPPREPVTVGDPGTSFTPSSRCQVQAVALPCRLVWRLYFSAFLCVCVYVCIYWMHAPYFIILITEWNTSSHAGYGTVDGVCQYWRYYKQHLHLRKSKVRMLCICIAQEVSELVPTLWWNPSPRLPSPHVF